MKSEVLPKIEFSIEDIAIVTLQNGGTAFKLDLGQFLPPMDVWTFPKYPGKTAILPHNIELAEALKGFIFMNEQFLRETDCWLGTWIHPETQDFYLDISTGCENLARARKMALEASRREGRKIVALYNSKRNETIYL